MATMAALASRLPKMTSWDGDWRHWRTSQSCSIQRRPFCRKTSESAFLSLAAPALSAHILLIGWWSRDMRWVVACATKLEVNYLCVWEVIVVDNFFTGRRRNVEHWIGHHNFELIHQDVIEPLWIEVDQIYHLACPASPPHYMYNPIKTIKVGWR